MHKRQVKGSYTIEAAIILPLIFFVILGLFYLGFYIHDRIKIQGIVHSALINGRNLFQHEADMVTGTIEYKEYLNRDLLYPYISDFKEKEASIQSYIQNKSDTGLFIAKLQEIKVKVNTYTIEINVTASMNFPFYQIEKLFQSSSKSINISNNCNTQSSEEFIRIFHVFSGVAEKNKQINKAINEIRKAINKVKK